MSAPAKRRPALVPVPERLAILIRLANQLPQALRSESSFYAKLKDPEAWSVVKREWNIKTEEATLRSLYYFQRLLDELPLELQAFILQERERSHPYKQLFENLALLGQSEDKLHDIVSRAWEVLAVYDESLWKKAHSVRRRLWFILAAEELLYWLVWFNLERINTPYYGEKWNSVYDPIYIEDDIVKAHPPILYSFIVGVQASRVRQCGICNNYFWAGRKDKKVCSVQCSATNRKQKQRERDLEKKLSGR
jgi:hypothetical protein